MVVDPPYMHRQNGEDSNVRQQNHIHCAWNTINILKVALDITKNGKGDTVWDHVFGKVYATCQSSNINHESCIVNTFNQYSNSHYMKRHRTLGQFNNLPNAKYRFRSLLYLTM